MRCALFCFLLASACAYGGWVMGALVTARQIALKIVDGELSLEQAKEAIADQIETGNYWPGQPQ